MWGNESPPTIKWTSVKSVWNAGKLLERSSPSIFANDILIQGANDGTITTEQTYDRVESTNTKDTDNILTLGQMMEL